jgi:hypothetical protein
MEDVESELRKICRLCGKETRTWHNHHVFERGWSGRGEDGPTVPLCPDCHDLVHREGASNYVQDLLENDYLIRMAIGGD